MIFTHRITGVLRALLAPATSLVLDARTEGGIGHQTFTVSDVLPDWLPVPLLTLMESRRDWHVRISPALRDGGGDVVGVRALFARFLLSPTCDASTAWAQRVSAEGTDEVLSRLAAFAVAPTSVIDAHAEVVAIWALDEAVPLAEATALQRRLASRLQASIDVLPHTIPSATGGAPHVEEYPADDPRSFVPLCGLVRGLGARGERVLVNVLDLHPDRAYPVAAMRAALEN